METDSETLTTEALLPCPFCGSPALVMDESAPSLIRFVLRVPQRFVVHCGLRQCPVMMATGCFETVSDAVRYWNTRKTISPGSPYRRAFSQEEIVTAARDWNRIHYADADPETRMAQMGMLIDFVTDIVPSISPDSTQ